MFHLPVVTRGLSHYEVIRKINGHYEVTLIELDINRKPLITGFPVIFNWLLITEEQQLFKSKRAVGGKKYMNDCF